MPGEAQNDVRIALFAIWSCLLSSADNWFTQLTTGNARARVARLLMLLNDNSEDDSFFLPTRDDMGAMLGITTESVSKVTAEFTRNGWLKPLQQHRAWIDTSEVQNHCD